MADEHVVEATSLYWTLHIPGRGDFHASIALGKIPNKEEMLKIGEVVALQMFRTIEREVKAHG